MEIILGLLLLPGGVHVCGGGEGGGEVGPAVLGVRVARVLALQGGHPAIPANKILLHKEEFKTSIESNKE